jgi:L-lactate utilization protein LutC
MSLFRKFFGPTDESSNEESQSIYNKVVDSSLTIEERFTAHFMKNGGKFIYCENITEVKEQFLNILVENDWFECEVQCNEQVLFSFLDENKLTYFTKPENPKFLFSTCENLIAEDGSVLFSSNQIKQKKPNELPKNIVVFATMQQILESKSDGLREIKKKYLTDYPTNITCIKYFEEAKEVDFLQYGSAAKNLYLLLLENQS